MAHYPRHYPRGGSIVRATVKESPTRPPLIVVGRIEGQRDNPRKAKTFRRWPEQYKRVYLWAVDGKRVSVPWSRSQKLVEFEIIKR